MNTPWDMFGSSVSNEFWFPGQVFLFPMGRTQGLSDRAIPENCEGERNAKFPQTIMITYHPLLIIVDRMTFKSLC